MFLDYFCGVGGAAPVNPWSRSARDGAMFFIVLGCPVGIPSPLRALPPFFLVYMGVFNSLVCLLGFTRLPCVFIQGSPIWRWAWFSICLYPEQVCQGMDYYAVLFIPFLNSQNSISF